MLQGNKIKFDYVVSGTGMLRLNSKKLFHEQPEFIKNKNAVNNAGILYLKEYINTTYPLFDLSISALYNAYVEPHLGEHHVEHHKDTFDGIYADSGGLQVITCGAQLTEELKTEVYKKQDMSDFSFCFDEIPVDRLHPTSGDIKYRVFNPSIAKQKAQETARNVKVQIETLQHSKVMYIVQGNTIDDMVKWMDDGIEVLGVENLHKLGGIAVSIACMGNGELESIDCVVACKIILDKYPQITKRLHLLGFGASRKLLPAFVLMNSGFLKDVILTADSTSQSMAFMMGHAKSIKKPNTRNKELIHKNSYREFFTTFEDFYRRYVPDLCIEELVQLMYDNNRSIGSVEEELYNDPTHKYYSICASIVPLYGLWNIVPMIDSSCKMIDELYHNVYYGLLFNVKTVEEYNQWRSANYSKIRNNRVRRKRKTLF